jgi:hypothetical protein
MVSILLYGVGKLVWIKEFPWLLSWFRSSGLESGPGAKGCPKGLLIGEPMRGVK